jgi:AcrR family transcriptional regulator
MGREGPARAADPDWEKPAYQARSREQRDRLLKAGERVFAEKGFWQAHVADIARRANCSVGSVYRRFRDKEAFFLSLQVEMAAHAEQNIARFFDDPACLTDPVDEVFTRLVRNTARTMRGIEGYYRALFELSLRGHDVWPPMRRIELLEAQRILDLLHRRGVTLYEPDPQANAHFAIRGLHGQIISAMQHGPGPYAIDDPRLHRQLALQLLRYLSSGPWPA